MLDVSSTEGFFVQCTALLVLGALVAVLVRLLRFRDSVSGISAARSSSLWALLAICAGWLLVVAVHFALRGDVGPQHWQSVSPAGPGDVIGQLFVALFAIGPVVFAMHRRREPFASAGASADNLGRSLIVGLFLVAAVAGWRFLVEPPPDIASFFHHANHWLFLQFVIVGFVEEFVYRGYLQTRLVGWLGPVQGWVLASVLMAMAHAGHRVAALGMAGEEALLSAAALVPISLFLGFVMLRTRSIVAPGILHTMINWLDV